MNPTTNPEASGPDLCESLRCGQPGARLRLLATVSSLVWYACPSPCADTRAEVSERIAARLAARIRVGELRSSAELLGAADAELARCIPRSAGVPPSRALLGRLVESLATLPEAQRRALSAHYAPSPARGSCDLGLQRQTVRALRERLGLEAAR